MKKQILIFATALLIGFTYTSCRESKDETSQAEEIIKEMEEDGAEMKVKKDGNEVKIKMDSEEKEVKIKTEDGETKIKVDDNV